MPIWNPSLDASDDGPVYRRIVQAMADDMTRGSLTPGTRLPPHRDLADTLGVARGTVAKAYGEAEKIGLVRSLVGSGTFVQAPDSGSRPYASLLEAPVVWNDLTTNAPLSGIDPDPADALQQIAVRPDRNALLRYQSNLGMGRHRQAGVEWAERLGVEVDADHVLLCSGAQHALFVTLAHLTRPGDAVLVGEWSYPGIHSIAETLRIRPIPVTMDRWGLCGDAVEDACRDHRVRALYCMPTVHNPLGITLSLARRRRLVELAREHELAIVEDAANQLFVAEPPPSLFELAPERTFLVASTSKMLSPGLRVAFLVAQPDAIAAVAKHVWASQWMVGALGAEIVAIWIEQGVADQTIKRKRREAVVRQRIAQRAFQDQQVQADDGSLHLWLRLPNGWQTDELVEQARRNRIAVTPAQAFWMRARPAPPAVRVALGGVNERPALRRGLRRLNQILHDGPASQHAPR